MRLLDLVEKNNGVWASSNCLGELATIIKADVAWRCANETARVVALHKLAHVDLDQRIFGAEHEFGERLRELSLTDAGWPKEEEAADRALRILQPSTCASHGAAQCRNCLLLPNHTSAQRLLHLQESCSFGFGQAHHWDAGPH